MKKNMGSQLGHNESGLLLKYRKCCFLGQRDASHYLNKDRILLTDIYINLS